MREIAARITSSDVDVLNQSLTFVRERCALENDRGKVAETRATALLAILGILAGFIVPFADSLDVLIGETRWTLIVTFLGSLLFLVKGLYYAIGVLSVSKQYRLKVDSVFDFQSLSRVDALREEIAGLVWECQKSVQPNTIKLFRLHRSQRSGTIAVILFMLFGVLLLIAKEGWVAIPQYGAFAAGAIVLLALFLTDCIAEKNGLWRESR